MHQMFDKQFTMGHCAVCVRWSVQILKTSEQKNSEFSAGEPNKHTMPGNHLSGKLVLKVFRINFIYDMTLKKNFASAGKLSQGLPCIQIWQHMQNINL